MKRFLRSLMLMMSLLGGGLVLPATAQTPLLEVDYNGATVFHVLDDGRLLLPFGAQDGYVLTTDTDGFATWQAVSASGGAVAHDATLTGDGTTGTPLGVAVPLTLTATQDRIVQGIHTNGTFGYVGSSTYGAYGQGSNGFFGYLGSNDGGAYGEHTNGNHGYLGTSGSGAYGKNLTGNFGYLGGTIFGAYGAHNTGSYGLLGSDDYGAYGRHINGNIGWLGGQDAGAYAIHDAGHHGALGGSFYGARGWNDNNNRGYLGHDNYGLWATGSPWAGYFAGNVHVSGTFSKAGGSFKIDHPLDPASRYLSHSFVESPDMMNVYNGNTTTDENGEAVVELPSYFEALNRDFRYQLTVIGTFAQAIVAEEIRDNHFVIRTDQPGVKVSWQVTGIRQDRWAEANRIVVEADKPTDERGFYLHPALYGQAEAQRIGRVEEEAAASVAREAERQRVDEERRQFDEEHERMQQERQRLREERGRQ